MTLKNNGMVYIKKIRLTGQTFHWHDELELLFVMEGSLNLKVGYENLRLNEGDIMFINSDEIHSFEACDNNVIVISVFIDCNAVYEKYPDFYEIIAIWPYSEAFEKIGQQKDIILKNIANIESVLENDGEFKDLNDAIDSLIKSLLYCYRLDITDPESGATLQINDDKKDVIYRIIKYLYSNYNHKVNLQDISEQEYLSMFYLSHSFKDITGYSFRDWLNFVRVEKAEKMLLETTLSITDISVECGFSDVRYFNKHFTKWYKISPSKYRNLFKDSFMHYGNTEEHEEKITYKDFISKFEEIKIENADEKIEEKRIYVNVESSGGETLSSNWKNELWCNGISLAGYREMKRIEDVQKELNFISITVDELFGLESGKDDSSLSEREIHVILNFLLDNFEKIYLIVNCGHDDFFELETAENVLNSFFDYYPKGRRVQIEFRLNIQDGTEQTLKKIGKFINTLDDLNIAYKRYRHFKKLTDKAGKYETDYLKNMIEGDLRIDWLFTQTNFRNNLYYFYYMLAQMSGNILAQEDNYVITGNQDSVQLFFHNEGTRIKIIKNIRYKAAISGLKGKYIVFNYVWDVMKNNVTSLVKSAYVLSKLTDKEREIIELASFPDVTVDYIDIEQPDEVYNYEVVIPSSAMHLTIIKKM